MHEADLIHGDIHPGNILQSFDNIYLADFGLTQRNDNIRFGSGTTGDLFFLLSSFVSSFALIGYFAPELHDGDKNSFATDIYSVGCIFARLLHAYDETLVPALEDDKDVPRSYAASLNVTSPAVSLLAMLLNSHPVYRPTAKAALSVPFLQEPITVPRQQSQSRANDKQTRAPLQNIRNTSRTTKPVRRDLASVTSLAPRVNARKIN